MELVRDAGCEVFRYDARQRRDRRLLAGAEGHPSGARRLVARGPVPSTGVPRADAAGRRPRPQHLSAHQPCGHRDVRRARATGRRDPSQLPHAVRQRAAVPRRPAMRALRRAQPVARRRTPLLPRVARRQRVHRRLDRPAPAARHVVARRREVHRALALRSRPLRCRRATGRPDRRAPQLRCQATRAGTTGRALLPVPREDQFREGARFPGVRMVERDGAAARRRRRSDPREKLSPPCDATVTP